MVLAAVGMVAICGVADFTIDVATRYQAHREQQAIADSAAAADSSGGGSGQTTLANWIISGCSCSTATPEWFWGDAGANFNSSEVNSALSQELSQRLLFPVYDQNRVNGGSPGVYGATTT
jgi:hypothetical protein